MCKGHPETSAQAGILLRQATETDLETVRQIAHETILTVYPHYYPAGAVEFFLAHHSERHIAEDLAVGNVFLAMAAGGAVGTVTVRGNEICRMFVLPARQKQGYGKALLIFAERQISKNHTVIRLDASLPAKAIYLKHGYRTVASHAIQTENGDFLCYDVMEKPSGFRAAMN
jgi:GNAT superfamily N-acetyltransferase